MSLPPDFRNIERDTRENADYRRVVYTCPGKMQLVLMSLRTGENIPRETHADVAQFVRVESGRGKAVVGRKTFQLSDGSSLIVPPGTPHYLENTAKDGRPLRLYTIYTPEEHADGHIDRRQPKPRNCGGKRKAQAVTRVARTVGTRKSARLAK